MDLFTLTPQEIDSIADYVQSDRDSDRFPFDSTYQPESIYVPVADGSIRVLHHKPEKGSQKRPVFVVPGWGANWQGFADLYAVIANKVEFYHLETREKNSSRIDKRRALFDVSQKARDVQAVLDYFHFTSEDDFVLFGTCWGGAVLLQGLIDKSITAPTVIAFDPMHALWFPKWVIKGLFPILPVWFLDLIKPIGKRIALAGMDAAVQRQRVNDFIDEATAWKWKQAAQDCVDFELLGNLSRIEQEVFVCNGTSDKIHDNTIYPQIAAEIPYGRFLYLQIDESLREHLMGKIVLEFCQVGKEAGVPERLNRFEKDVGREFR